MQEQDLKDILLPLNIKALLWRGGERNDRRDCQRLCWDAASWQVTGSFGAHECHGGEEGDGDENI